MSSAPTHLKKRRLGWYVQVAIPRKLQHVLGKSPILRSLQTRDEAEAKRLRHKVLDEIFSEFRRLESVGPERQQSPEAILESARLVRAAMEAGEVSPRDAEISLEATVDDFLEEQAKAHGVDEEGRPNLPASAEGFVRRAYNTLAGRRALENLAETYLSEQEKRLTAQTVGDKRRRIEAFFEWFGGEREPREVTRRVAGSYLTDVIQRRTQKAADGSEEPLSAKTRTKEVSDLRTFFQWLVDRGYLEENPFKHMARSIGESSRAEPVTRRPWKPAELSKVLRGIDCNDAAWSLAVIAAYTGMRREEVGELEVSSVHGDVLQVERGKTRAANRAVPIHPVIAPLIKQLAETSTDGYLIPGLLRGGSDKKRSWYVGKRFGRVIRQLGVKDKRVDFHSLRVSVVSQLEEAGVPLSTIQLIVGHRRQGVTFSSYSAEGISPKARREALLKVSYGDELDSFVKTTGRKVVVKASAKPRKA
jgi:integrase